MPQQPEKLVENFFRHESANLLAVLTRAFGFSSIELVEDMVQESMLEALRTWRLQGVPDNPAGWLHRVARNRIIDVLRRDRSTVLEAVDAMPPECTSVSFEPDEVEDSLLRMVFACCHPSLDRQSQLALTLKVLCGLGDREIARGLLISPAAAKKRVVRARRRLQQNQVTLELPEPAGLTERLDSVHEVLYLMFNEGYSATEGDVSVRVDLCEESARLCHVLCVGGIGSPATRALLALMLFHAARLDSRVRPEGAIVLLEEQDRSHWDRRMIGAADAWLQRSMEGQEVSRFHFEAGIARAHCHADSVATTDWDSILQHYDGLLSRWPSPVYVLNRAVTLGQLNRVSDGLLALESIGDHPRMAGYPLLDCAYADLLLKDEQPGRAAEHLQRALKLVTNPMERALIQRRLSNLVSA